MPGGGGGFRNIHVMMTANATQLRAQMAAAGRDVTAFDRHVQASNASVGRMSKGMKAAAAIGVAALAVGFSAAVSKAVEFDREMRNVNSIMKLSEDEFRAVSARVLQLSTELPQSADVLARGLYDIASAGFQGADGLAVLEASATAAAAGLSETDVAAKAITAILNAYGMEASEASDVSDILFKTVETGVITFDQLAGTMGNIVGVASAAKIPIEEITAAQAAMTLSGIGAAEATTSLNRVVTSLLDPGDHLAGVIRQLGYESGIQMLEVEGLYGAMELLRLHAGGSVEEMMALFPEIRAMRGAFALTAAEGQNYAKTFGEIAVEGEAVGATQSALGEQLKSVSLQWDLFRSSVSAALITVGTRLLPGLLAVLDGVQDLAGAVGSFLLPIMERLGPVAGSVGSALASVWDVVVALAGAVGPLVAGLAAVGAMGVISAIGALAEVLASVAGWIANSEVAIGTLGVVLAVKLIPSLVAAVGHIGAWIALRFEAALSGATRGVSRLGGALRAIGWVAAIGAVVSLVTHMGRLREEARDAGRTFHETFGAGIDTSRASGQLEAWGVQIDRTRERIRELYEEVQRGGLLGTGIGSLGWSAEAMAEIQGLGEAIEDLQTRSNRAAGTIAEAGNVILTSLGVQLTVDEIGKLADALEIDLATASREEAVPALLEAAAAARAGKDDYADLALEIDALASAQQRATQALEEYVTAQEELFDPLLRAQRAQRQRRDALREVEELERRGKQHTREYAEATENLVEKNLAAESALIGLFSAVQRGEVDLGAARRTMQRWQEQGTLTEDAVERLRDTFGSLVDAADRVPAQVGIEIQADGTLAHTALDSVERRAFAWSQSEPEAEVRADPAPARRIFRWAGAAALGWARTRPEARLLADNLPASRSIRGARLLAELYGRMRPEARLRADTKNARNAIQRFLDRIREWFRNPFSMVINATVKDPQGDGPGRFGGGSALRTVQNAMQGLPGLRVTSTYRSPAHNRRVGGSPTSYHLDRLNPAVDVAGPTRMLDLLYNRLRSVPRRELIWRAPGHYDHLHFAARGALFNPIREQHRAQIASAGDWRVWAEPETGGEAYIPFALDRRPRSTAILDEVARRFGYDLVPMGHGGIIAGAGGGAASRGGGRSVTIEQHYYGSDARLLMREGRHQARIAAREVGR